MYIGIISDPLVGTNLVAFVNVLATYIALKIMDLTPRRTLILYSSGGMLISTLFIILALNRYLPNYIALVAVMAFVSFFEIGIHIYYNTIYIKCIYYRMYSIHRYIYYI